VSVHVVNKETYFYQIIKILGTSCDANEIQQLVLRGKEFISASNPTPPFLLPIKSREEIVINEFAHNLRFSRIHRQFISLHSTTI